jgi:hypothetical protein
MSNLVKIPSGDAGIVLETPSLADSELKKLESCIDLLVGVTNSLNAELASTNNKPHYIRCAKAIQCNAEAIRRLTVSIYDIKLKERRAGEKDISPSDWESL